MQQDIWLSWHGVPIWEWIGTALIASVFVALFLFIVREFTARRPVKIVHFGDSVIELWVRERKMPAPGEGIVVPVAPDLKMAVGIAKWVKDATANYLQVQADRAAPLPPGEVFVGKGGRYKFGHAALAVVMDDTKRTSPAWITEAVALGISRLRDAGADIVILPDMTEDLLRQPASITDEQRRTTCAPIARATIEGILAYGDTMTTVRLWVWRKEYADVYLAALNRLDETGAHSEKQAATA